MITNGSVQADEQMYWYAAQTLAKDGYVVLTFDPQGQGQSDTLGQARPLEGVPAQTDGRPFYDGTEDAIDFLLSTAEHPYEPVPSCENGTSHADKQTPGQGRARHRLQPVLAMLEPSEIGLAGTPTARPASPTSRSGTRGSRPSWPGTTSVVRVRKRVGATRQRGPRWHRRGSCPADPSGG